MIYNSLQEIFSHLTAIKKKKKKASYQLPGLSNVSSYFVVIGI